MSFDHDCCTLINFGAGLLINLGTNAFSLNTPSFYVLYLCTCVFRASELISICTQYMCGWAVLLFGSVYNFIKCDDVVYLAYCTG